MQNVEPIIASLAPIRRELVYDILKDGIGADVSDWANYKKGLTAPAANPKYCYEWCFTQGEIVVLNLWHASLSARRTDVVCEINMRAYANEIARAKDDPWREKRPKPVWEKRATKMDLAIQLAARKKLPVRVIVCEGNMRDVASGDEKASQVKRRALDSVPWWVESYDLDSGQTVLCRTSMAFTQESQSTELTNHSVAVDTDVPAGEVTGSTDATDPVTDARVVAIRRMVTTAVGTVSQANGQTVEGTVKVKENHFASEENFEAYVNDLLVAQGNRCALSRLTLQFDGEHTDPELLVSLDRIDSSGHYAPGNLQVVCRFINRWKSADDNAEFKRLMNLVQGC